jgi:MATE family multidrug resistance protein
MAVSMDTAARLLPAPARGGLREVVNLAYPVILTNVSQTLIHTVDSAMVGRLGATHLAAVGYALIWYWTVACFFFGAVSGVQTFVSQAHGAGRSKDCGAWAWHGIYALVPLACVGVGVFALGCQTLFGWLGPSAEVQELAAAYVHGRAWGIPGLIAGVALASFFRGIGDMRTPMYSVLIANVVNVVLDYGLIFGELGMPNWGIAGAGVATGAAEWTQFVFVLLIFRRRRIATEYQTARVGFDRSAVSRFMRTSLPIGGQWMIEMLSFALFANLVARMGDIQMAASQAMLVLQHMSFMQVYAVSMAATTLVGRYRGMGDIAAVERSHVNSLGLGVAFAVGVGILFVCFPQPLLRIFTDDAEVLRLGAQLLLVGAIFQTCDAIGVVTSGSLRGAGDTRWPFVVQASLAWALLLPSAYLFGHVLEGGVTGAWLGGVLYLGTLGAVLLARFRRGAWQRIQI